MTDALSTVLSRIVGSIVAGLAAWLLAKYGLHIDQQQVTAAIVTLLMVVFGVVYAIIHRLISAHTNPVDAASPAVAAESRRNLKAGRRTL